ncbi:hypothetical protein BC937DRAFT_89892 [Endogone sp. FLAS-F59071]|nr:hypothetical protein BC937DRAFT_89892 [Endogone sp. FLAS-F59071]|eukprot:RUS17510.1 hypothetical protein BC937DRAFT_89892 [Endogone sp. FLAS-F59071]
MTIQTQPMADDHQHLSRSNRVNDVMHIRTLLACAIHFPFSPNTMPPNPNDALTKPHATTLSMWKLYDLMERGLIDLDAEYQRDVVWAHNKMSHLIDSILKNYYVPPVLFAIKQNAEGRNVRVCVDGKQRLTSIKNISVSSPRFMDNEIPHINPGDPKIVRRYYDYDEKRKP